MNHYSTALCASRLILFCFVSAMYVQAILAQGTINFANLVIENGTRIVDAPVHYYDGSLLAGSQFVAQLYAAQTFDSLAPVALQLHS
jgi:hypothetical protein